MLTCWPSCNPDRTPRLGPAVACAQSNRRLTASAASRSGRYGAGRPGCWSGGRSRCPRGRAASWQAYHHGRAEPRIAWLPYRPMPAAERCSVATPPARHAVSLPHRLRNAVDGRSARLAGSQRSPVQARRRGGSGVGNRLGAGAVKASMAGRRRRAGLAVAAVALLLGAVSSCGSAAGYDRGRGATSTLVAHQLLRRHRLASGWAYLIGQRGSAADHRPARRYCGQHDWPVAAGKPVAVEASRQAPWPGWLLGMGTDDYA